MDELSWVLVIGSITGAVLNNYKKRICFVLWFCTNIGWIVVNLSKGIPAAALLAFVFMGMNVHGFIQWRQKGDPR